MKDALRAKEKVFLRNVKPGQVFLLKRTMKKYKLVSRDKKTPAGTHYIVEVIDKKRRGTLHHACHVIIVDGDL